MKRAGRQVIDIRFKRRVYSQVEIWLLAGSNSLNMPRNIEPVFKTTSIAPEKASELVDVETEIRKDKIILNSKDSIICLIDHIQENLCRRGEFILLVRIKLWNNEFGQVNDFILHGRGIG